MLTFSSSRSCAAVSSSIDASSSLGLFPSTYELKEESGLIGLKSGLRVYVLSMSGLCGENRGSGEFLDELPSCVLALVNVIQVSAPLQAGDVALLSQRYPTWRCPASF